MCMYMLTSICECILYGVYLCLKTSKYEYLHLNYIVSQVHIVKGKMSNKENKK